MIQKKVRKCIMSPNIFIYVSNSEMSPEYLNNDLLRARLWFTSLPENVQAKSSYVNIWAASIFQQQSLWIELRQDIWLFECEKATCLNWRKIDSTPTKLRQNRTRKAFKFKRKYISDRLQRENTRKRDKQLVLCLISIFTNSVENSDAATVGEQQGACLRLENKIITVLCDHHCDDYSKSDQFLYFPHITG